MTKMTSDQSGTIIEQPLASEVYTTLPQPADYLTKATDKVKKWRSRIDASRAMRDIKLSPLEKWIDFYEGNQWGNKDESGIDVVGDRATVNLIFENIKQELPSLYFDNPYPIVTAKRNEFELSAFAMQELLKNYIKYNMGTELKKHVRLAILDAKFIFGCLKTTYTPRFSVNPNKGQPVIIGYTPDKIPIFQQDEEGNFVAHPDKIITSDLYYVERVSPREMLIDVECRNFVKRSPWIGQEIVKPLEYIKESKLYKNTEALSANVEYRQRFPDRTSEEESAARQLSDSVDTEKVRFVEIHDLENNELLVLADNGTEFIREEKMYMNPFTFLKFNEKPDAFYPVSDIKQEIPMQQEVNIGNTLMLIHARHSARKYVIDNETFSNIDEEEGMEALKNPEDMTIVKCSDIEHAPVPIGMAPSDPGIYQSLMQSVNNFNRIAGGTEAGTGFTQRRKTGKEAQFQEQHGAVRRVDKQNLVADFVTETFTNLGQLMQATLSTKQAIKIIGAAGMFWTQVERKDIQGELFYEVDVMDIRPQVPDQDKRELAEFIQSIASFMGALAQNPLFMQVMNIQGTIKELAKPYPSLKVENILNGQITPEQVAQAAKLQMENQKNANI